ncbi:Uncharacterised protein [Mycobacteroides abscessus]|nr:Uncharacterised protein [Mycobacteroides abscessus]
MQKNTPTPLDRMSLTVCSTCSRNAFDASANSRCASSKMNTSLGLSTSPISGSFVNRLARIHIRNVENRTGRAACAPSSTRVMTPLSPDVRIRSFGSISGSPKNVSPPSASRLISARRITPAVAADTPPRFFRSALPSSLVRYVMTARRSFRSCSGSCCWSAQWKINPSVDSWVALSPSTFDSKIGPKLRMVARTGTPIPLVPSDTNSVGKPVGTQSSPVSLARAAVLSPASPGWEMPDRSPLTSAMTTGTPAALSCSAIT